MHRRFAALGIALVTTAALSLAACSSGAQPAPAGSAAGTTTAAAVGPANPADVQFAQMMIVHHEGAIEMARLAPDRAEATEVTELAQRVEAAQQPEIEAMTGWLDEWGAEPLSSDGAMPGMDHGSMTESGESGMASDTDMQRLRDASGAEFDALFLELMIVHHRGAVTMAQTEVDEGRNEAAVALAHAVIVDQTGEISLMETLLASS